MDARRDATRADTGPADPLDWSDCRPAQTRCVGEVHQRCVAIDQEFTRVEQRDCAAEGLVCVAGRECLVCRPGERRCSLDDDARGTTADFDVEVCRDDGSGWDTLQHCDVPRGEACRAGLCVNLCNYVGAMETNIGCEYMAVDLDNAVEMDGRSAASQQYAVVVSNPDRSVTARVQIELNTAPPGQPVRTQVVASAVIPPRDLQVFPLQSREVDCSPPGSFNTGTGTCLSSQAYRITSTAPVIAYQFNPLSNVDVYSNDASLLIPTNSLQGSYVVMSWPQTIATTGNGATDTGEDLRTFVTVVGSQPNTRVRVTTTTDVIPGGPFPLGLRAGVPAEVTLGPFDVLNLESGGFLADFTGTQIEVVGDQGRVAVFSGSEASDSPVWTSINERQCCADHMEEQNFPVRAAGQDFVVPHLPSRTAALSAAGGLVPVVPEVQFFKVYNPYVDPVTVQTTLPRDPLDPTGPTTSFTLRGGEQRTLVSLDNFEVHASGPLLAAIVTGGQATTGIPNGYPGGDPSFILVQPLLQWRSSYVFLTPDKYAFDFVTITARATTHVSLDGTPLPFSDCPQSRADACVDTPERRCPPPTFVVYRCQLSFPLVDPNRPRNMRVSAGRQGDGVHVVESDDQEYGVFMVVSGFDSYVGYGYPGGARTRTIN